MTYRIFQGSTIWHLDGHSGSPADPQAWYYEPHDYAGDALYSLGHFSREDAIAAAEAEFSIVASWRLDARIDAELDRLGWSSRTAPEGNSTLDAWNTATTDQDGIVTLHDDQEVTPFHGLVLLHTLQGLQPAISWDDLWQAILPHMVEE